MVKVLVISDLHYEKRIYKGVDQSRTWEWLLSIVDYHRPDLLLSCGDWGHDISYEEYYELLKRTLVYSIYGNHENMDVLTELRNIKSSLPVLMEDGRIYELQGLRIAGISGIIAKKRKTKKGVPRRTPEEFLETARKLEGKEIDVLLIHETPYLPQLFSFMAKDFRGLTVLEAIRIVKPRLVINGHMHSGCYKVASLSWSTKYIYISSDQKERCYLVLNTMNGNILVEVWKDFEVTNEFSV